ncbi:MAG: HAMP domain-containing histidine kinase [Bifidobacteriaceae bacterium]|jgi:signal transduction histidine kinase|nr:HAMP domain-containing histidine kinase [Bifidobacteriaceae bacterium]
MTIRRRLFLSNTLMLVLPVFLTLATFVAGELVLLHLFGFDVEVDSAEPEGDELTAHLAIVAALLAFIIVIVVVTNRVLTHFVTKRITTSIDTLSSGVHELRDGNLDYRIDYSRDDEFRPVCADFNEMAERLSDMVAARQRDEASRRELIAGISHDLRTPLTAIKAYLEGLDKGVASTPEDRRRYLDTIRAKADDLEHIISQLFLFTKLDLGEFPLCLERADVGRALREFVASVESEYAAKGLTVSLAPPPDALWANLDIVQFRNVLHNVLANSVTYATGDGPGSLIELSGDGVSITVSLTDDGPGVPPESTGRLFDMFYRADLARQDSANGSGLGLAIARKMVGRLGGAMRAENAEPHGLRIVVTLPRVEGDR